MDLYHVNIATVGRAPMLLDTAGRRALLRTLCRVGGPRLWLFGAADDHVHFVAPGPPGVLAGHLHLAIEALDGAPRLQPAWAEPVRDRTHARTLVGYVVKQSDHHGLGPTTSWEGSCFRDLVGARRVAGFDPRAWRQGMPREDSRLVWAALGLERPAPVGPHGLPLGDLVACATRVTAADPALSGREPAVVRARRLAAALAREAAFPSEAVANVLGCTRRAVQIAWSVGADPADVAAARLDLAIERRYVDRPR